ncbi:ATP-dependent RNA helicase dhh1 [Coccidioides immitis RMSCC 3703]|uniref:ATP-dependent RNA helicase dhh1 n=1 Tax=Coccidioides immitis RMSCC 3703 TaxID=454286 RepID=A0A0J8QJ86_COCIT|nr:ATP-dependent RNA helicase dhh1 [Coccidioides immitis RMSCC 3703]
MPSSPYKWGARATNSKSRAFTPGILQGWSCSGSPRWTSREQSYEPNVFSLEYANFYYCILSYRDLDAFRRIESDAIVRLVYA